MRAGLATLTLLVGCIATASAHETWMLPSSFSTRVGEPIRFDVTSGMGFPEPESAIRPDRVRTAKYRLGRDQTSVDGLSLEEKSLVLAASFPREGIATVWLELQPRGIELSHEQVAEYFDEIGATEAIRSSYAIRRGRGAWKEKYTKHVKTFVAMGDPRQDASWKQPVGMSCEIVPQSDPFALHAGGKLEVLLVAGGRPLAGAPLGLLIRGAKERIFRTTDRKGRATFPVEQAGEALVFAVHLRPVGDDNTWQSDFTTLTLRVR